MRSPRTSLKVSEMFKKKQPVLMLNCMGVSNEPATIVRQMPESYPLKDHAEWWLVRFADSRPDGGLYVHQSQLQALGANGGPV